MVSSEQIEGARQAKAGADMAGKALTLLELLGEYPQGEQMSRLSREAGYPLTTTNRLLLSLMRHGFVSYDEQTRRYSLGLKVFELGQRVSHARGFSGVALPVMDGVTRETSEQTLMSLLDGSELVFVHSVQGPQRMQITGRPGGRGPLHCTAMGKVLVAFQPQADRERLVAALTLSRFTPRTIVNRDDFRREIDRVHSQGYAVTDEEHEAGILAVAVPIFRPDGAITAALSVVAPAYRTSLAALQDFVPLLQDAARELSALLPSH
jgi:IclR family acetate operon transcriptional repressor